MPLVVLATAMTTRPPRTLLPLALLAGALVSAGCVAPLLEPLEEPLLYRPSASDKHELELLAAAKNRVEEVRIKTADGLLLHGWLKRPEHWRDGERHALVIFYGGLRQEASGFLTRARADDPRGEL